MFLHTSNILLGTLLIQLAMGCGLGKRSSNGETKPPEAPAKPVFISVDPKDHARFDAIMKANVDERFKKQIGFLQHNRHDLQWFPGSVAKNVEQHDTVQMIRFDASDRVIGFCSGAFAAAHLITTAGHCVNFVDMPVGSACKGRVVFAYKANATSMIQYFECDKLVAGAHSGDSASEEQSELIDHVLFSLSKPIEPSVRPSMNFNISLRESFQSEQKLAEDLLDETVIGLFVDPPSQYGDFSSQYDAVQSIVVNKQFDQQMLYLKERINMVQQGNSGGPLYRVNQRSFNMQVDSVRSSEMDYLSPLAVIIWGTNLSGQYVRAVGVSNPLVTAQAWSAHF